MFDQIDKKKQLLDSKRPFSREAVRNLKAYFDVEYTYNSNAIEGNTLTLTETKLVIEDGITIGKGKTLREHLEAINHKEAIDFVEDIVKENIELSERVIRELHYIVLKSIDDRNAGRYRELNVRISGSRHVPPEHVLILEKMNSLMQWYHDNKKKLNPIELAAMFHFKFVNIHPFVDGNGRTGRLLMNLILLQNGYPVTVIKMEERAEYMTALEIASVENLYEDFIKIVAQAVERSLDVYLSIVD